MFSSLSTNNFEGRVKLKNKLFSKKKALISNDGLDLKKIKVKFNVKWIYIQFLCNIFKVFMLSENQQAYASDFAFFIVFIELQKQLSKFLLISMNFAIQGKHCVETWATICDQNNPIFIRDLDREECRVGPGIFGTERLTIDHIKKGTNIVHQLHQKRIHYQAAHPELRSYTWTCKLGCCS